MVKIHRLFYSRRTPHEADSPVQPDDIFPGAVFVLGATAGSDNTL